MSLLSRLFGGGGNAQAKSETAVTYKEFAITPEPQREGTNWRIAARIEKDGRSHQLIRADQLSDRDECVTASVNKAKQVIDEQGDRLFG